jgi:succinyl-CoA synthetase beta subunit
VKEGQALINESGLNLTSAVDLEDAAKKAAQAVKGK